MILESTNILIYWPVIWPIFILFG